MKVIVVYQFILSIQSPRAGWDKTKRWKIRKWFCT